ncbi:hypothetical protein [Nonomuraea aridisoli]|nr:hypothetical protein [Nonomuraea aridisoli]
MELKLRLAEEALLRERQDHRATTMRAQQAEAAIGRARALADTWRHAAAVRVDVAAGDAAREMWTMMRDICDQISAALDITPRDDPGG